MTAKRPIRRLTAAERLRLSAEAVEWLERRRAPTDYQSMLLLQDVKVGDVVLVRSDGSFGHLFVTDIQRGYSEGVVRDFGRPVRDKSGKVTRIGSAEEANDYGGLVVVSQESGKVVGVLCDGSLMYILKRGGKRYNPVADCYGWKK